ncbi:MAG TPA: protein-disulfide reductase DsbD domain-containing protein [Bryobacteraceae bacterium]|nr:protein-disulfide reductase DsbD domain-containing protein [Bryobacteraceae bacterium]
MTSITCWARRALILAILTPSLLPQSKGVLSVSPVEKLTIPRGASRELKILAQLQPGFHVNSNTPSEEYLIPLKLTWAKEPLQAEQVIYPKPQSEKYDFSPTPLSVFSGNFEIVTKFKAPADARNGPAIMNGKLRYQACNNKECLAPRTVEIAVTLDIQ